MAGPLTWRERKRQLRDIIGTSEEDDTVEGQAQDAYFLQRDDAQDKASMAEFNLLRFTNRDLSNFGALAHGPFGSVDMVRCKLDNKLYVRKSIEKKVVARNPSQCFPHHEKDILLASTLSNCAWAPHLLCTFQTRYNLCYVMDFAEGGSLGDLLESSGQISETDLKWWLPQMITAIHWCHSQGFCHRDVKPSNFVVTSTGHLLIIDFASSARLLPPDEDGVQLVPKESCLVLCGTCDYISPEILAMQEDALVALDDEDEIVVPRGTGGYGRETDWWSLGATLYELIYGVAPFFAKDIRGTYELIMNHERKLQFPISNVSPNCISFISGLLRPATRRMGRRNIDEITDHKLLVNVNWGRLQNAYRPASLQLPQFEYDLPANSIQDDDMDESFSKGYAFSAFFNSSVSSSNADNVTNLTFARIPSPHPLVPQEREEGGIPSHAAQYVGFTWGPTTGAFDDPLPSPTEPVPPHSIAAITPPHDHKPQVPRSGPASAPQLTVGQQRPFSALVTPIRASSLQPGSHVPPSTIRRTAGGGTARKAGSTRALSEVEALKQMGDCVMASARKRLSHNAGRTPGPPGSASTGPSRVKRRASWVRMTLDFERLGVDEDEVEKPAKRSGGNRVAFEHSFGEPIQPDEEPSVHAGEADAGLRIFVKERTAVPAPAHAQKRSSVGSLRSLRSISRSLGREELEGGGIDQSTGGVLFGTVVRSEDELTSTTDGAPPSPSPSPRPTSAMSRPASSLSRRGGAAMLSSASVSATARKDNKPVSFRKTSTSTSASGSNSAPASVKISAQLPAPIFTKPITAQVQEERRQPSGSATRVPSISSASSIFTKPEKSRSTSEVLDLDMDATPRPRNPGTSAHVGTSGSHISFMPKATSMEPKPARQERVVSNGEHQQEDMSFTSNRNETRRQPLPPAPSGSNPFDEMEERLRRMMQNIKRVEGLVADAREAVQK